MPISLSRVLDRPAREAEANDAVETRAVATARHLTDPFVEEFRLLAMNVLAMLEGNPRKAVTIFSPRHGDGRTRIAVELSRALAQHTDVLLIDGQANATGLHESLLITGPSSGGSQPEVATPLIPTDQRRLWLSSESHGAGAGGELAHRMKEAMAAGMMVVIDAPASEASSDAFMLAQRSQNVLYVMRNKPQDMAPHRRAMDHLRRLDARVLGIVLNDR